GVARAVHVRVVAIGRLVLDVRGGNRNAALALLRSVVNRVERAKRVVRIMLGQHLRDRRRQRRLAVINMPYRPHIHVRLRPVKLLLRHLLLLNSELSSRSLSSTRTTSKTLPEAPGPPSPPTAGIAPESVRGPSSPGRRTSPACPRQATRPPEPARTAARAACASGRYSKISQPASEQMPHPAPCEPPRRSSHPELQVPPAQTS